MFFPANTRPFLTLLQLHKHRKKHNFMTYKKNDKNAILNRKSTDVATQPKLLRRISDEVKNIYNDKGIREILGKFVISGAKKVPGFGDTLTLLEEGHKYIQLLEQKQRHARLEMFVTGVINTLPEQADITQGDFLAVLRKVLQDDEESKIWLYVRLLVKLGTGTLDRDTRFHFIHMTQHLTFKQINFARELYLRKTLDLKGYSTREDAERELTGTKDGMTQRALFTLTNWGLIRGDPT